MPVTVPKVAVVNLTPTLMALASPESTLVGVMLLPQIEQGQFTFTETPGPDVSIFPLSSVARERILVEGYPAAVHGYDHETVAPSGVVIVAGCQVEPPSVDTSTPATLPPPVSVAVPVIATALP
jgi:hypothetical protein